ncbi:MAG TPA: GNAT family N-acetyltransferase [Natronosporangium sp.]
MREPTPKREPTCVGAFVRDDQNRVFVHRRTPTRRLLPGIWDFIGGHLEPGETPEEALARELFEETGWRLRRIEALIADWEWQAKGEVNRELDYLVEVDGDLNAPRLEEGKHDAYAWVGLDNLELMMEGRTDGDRRARDLVAKAARIRLTERLRLEPVGVEHAEDLWRLHHDEAVAAWHGGRYTFDAAYRRAASGRRAWEAVGFDKWMAYDRTGGELVGRGGLSRAELDGRSCLEMGWTVRSDRWGRGYATEIGRAGLAFAFDELGADSVIAFTQPHNFRSQAVMNRLGMQYLRDVSRDGSRLRLYAIARDQRPAVSRDQ